jgi:Protein of unknown function (DUF3631)
MINLLDDVDAAIRKYCVLPDEHSYTAVGCWVAYTHMSDLFDFAPRLLVRSPEKQSGKSRLLEVMGELVYNPSYWVKPTEATLFRKIDSCGSHPPTLIFDEVDAWLPESPDAVRGLINTGFRVGATVPRMGGSQFTDLQEFSVFAPIALAGIGSVTDTIEDRSVIIEMRRRKQHETVQKYRIREGQPALNKLRDMLAACSREDRVQELVAKALRDGIPMPNVGDRQEDAWEPLLITATAMGGRSWVERALFACKHLCDTYRAEAPTSPLLSDIAGVFDRAGSPGFMPTEGGNGLRTHLTMDAECRESGWCETGPGYLSAKRLGTMLRKYGIRSEKSPDRTVRGYYLSSFGDAFDRYLHPPEDASDPSNVAAMYPDQPIDAEWTEETAGPDASDASHASGGDLANDIPSSDASDASDVSSDYCGDQRETDPHGTPDAARIETLFGVNDMCPDHPDIRLVRGRCGLCIASKHNQTQRKRLM